jgi:hypothetical protein
MIIHPDSEVDSTLIIESLIDKLVPYNVFLISAEYAKAYCLKNLYNI